MLIHRIQDDTDSRVVNLLSVALSEITDKKIIQNYSPEFKDNPSNLFFILKNGRYSSGAYYVIENNGEYVASAGWNRYTDDIAILLSRSFIHPKFRLTYPLGNFLLPIMLEESILYDRRWITFNDYNKGLYNWISKKHEKSLWPEVWKKFSPIGIHNVYDTEQYVVEYKR